ncbi:hypothetical protein E2C01_078928 [Portunus trituberculatus]|uniref:Uncharacterized protein n=1 Tax=Portunus trituberculatus TaxID=210409 RepID=A0A5B7IQ14_PORTR|nr:hypothetical protein [Portunus trituberculatus]
MAPRRRCSTSESYTVHRQRKRLRSHQPQLSGCSHRFSSKVVDAGWRTSRRGVAGTCIAPPVPYERPGRRKWSCVK